MGAINDKMLAKLTPEQRAELDEMRAASATPEARSAQEVARMEVMAEFPPLVEPAAAELLAKLSLMRRRKRVSMDRMATLTGMPKSAISRLEAGKGNPTHATLSRYARGLEMRIEMDVVEDAG